MGKQKGWCLLNARLGFGIETGKFASAKADYEYQKKHKTIHKMPAPNNVAVPVYCDTTSKYEHVIVSDHGVIYSDGKKSSLKYFKCFGWGEYCDGVRVVKYVEDKKKTNTQIAKEVIQGKWGNGYTRKVRLKKAGYDYNTIQKLVNKMLYK